MKTKLRSLSKIDLENFKKDEKERKRKVNLLLKIGDKLGSLDTSEKEYDKTMEKMRHLSERDKERIIFLLSANCLALRSVIKEDCKKSWKEKKEHECFAAVTAGCNIQ